MIERELPLWGYYQENDYMSDPNKYEEAEAQYLEHEENLTHKNND